MLKADYIIIDFDSTFIKLETIEVLADFALENKKDKKNILDLIKKMTNKAMQGEIPFSDALYERINLINLKLNSKDPLILQSKGLFFAIICH